MSAARFRSRDEKAMWPIASTTGTMPGFLVMSMCSIVLPRYLDLSADSVALRGLVFSSAMGEAPSRVRGKGDGPGKNKKPPRSTTVCHRVGQPPLRTGVAFTVDDFLRMIRRGQEIVSRVTRNFYSYALA